MRTEVANTDDGSGDDPGARSLQKRLVAAGAHRTVYRHDGSSRVVSSRVELELAGVADVEGLVKPVQEAGGRLRSDVE